MTFVVFVINYHKLEVRMEITRSGATEKAGLENAGPLKMQGGNAGLENVGPNRRGGKRGTTVYGTRNVYLLSLIHI